jgi:DNA gyrase/topoisomerase IV subunit A
MASTNLQLIHKELHEIKQDIEYLKHIMSEEFALTDLAKKQLNEARRTLEKDYISQEEMESEFL